MKLKTFRFAPLAAVLLAAVFLHGCGYRAEAAPLASNAPAAAETTPAPTETPVFTVEYRVFHPEVLEEFCGCLQCILQKL